MQSHAKDDAVVVRDVGKRYRIGARQGGMFQYQSLRDSIANAAKFARRRRRAGRGALDDDGNSFWALKDVNFSVKRGEVVGVIGRNGAGKSTMLKVLSRITKPTTGEIEVRGRVGSLLEVGTGFHPELTGRENIYLNGAILGMTRREVKLKFDDIAAFSEIERFLDTPVKQYSSGMYTRLAFAVAAHLEPEILVVDEVLAVGDAAFQKKCLGKMKDVAAQGRTVLFVSHNMAAVQTLCDAAIVFSRGRAGEKTGVDAAIQRYMMDSASAGPGDLRTVKRVGTGDVVLTEIAASSDLSPSGWVCGAEARLRFTIDNRTGKPVKGLKVATALTGTLGQPIVQFNTDLVGGEPDVPPGQSRVELRIPRCPLIAGSYTLTTYLGHGQLVTDWIGDAGAVEVFDGAYFPSGKSMEARYGHVCVDHVFERMA
jgi:lipopolysaccharide transport system ATP-binding protein